MKSFGTALLTIALVATGASTVSAGIEDEQVTVLGPLSGASYQSRYSCASGTLQSIFRSDSGRRIVVEQTLLTNAGAGGTAISSVASHDLNSPVNLTSKVSAADVWKIEETFEGPEPFDHAQPLVTVAEGVLDCPDYAAPSPSSFVPITPERVLDTRPEHRINHSGPQPGAKSTVDIPRANLPGAPVGAVAVSVTVTVTEASGRGFVQLLPTGSTPGGSSNVNPQYPGHTLANNAVSPLSSAGVSLYTNQPAHLIVDVNGYFVESSGAARSGRYNQLAGTERIIDTRPATQINHSAGIIKAGSSLTIPVATLAGLGNDPVGSVAINVTATQTAGRGFLQSAPTGSLEPGASSIINSTRAGDTVAAMTIVPVSASGKIDIYTAVDAHVIVDVLGWFTNADAAPSTAGRFVPLEPERILDTRVAGDPVNCCSGHNYGKSDFDTGRFFPATRATVEVDQIYKAGAETLMINVTAVDATSRGFFQAGAANQFVNGESSTVNATSAGATVANAAVVGIGSVGVPGFEDEAFQIYTKSGGHILADVAGYFTR